MSDNLYRELQHFWSEKMTVEERHALEKLWKCAGEVKERPAMSDSESDDLYARIEVSAGLADERVPEGTPPGKHGRADVGAVSGRFRTVAHSVGLGRASLIAAAAAAVVALIILLPDRPLVYSAAPGQQLTAELPDGSSVILNSDSKIEFEGMRGDERTVVLSGEAYFSVARLQSTFRVKTDNAVIRVLGTRFNVRSRPIDGRPATTVGVTEGRVALRATGQEGAPVILYRDETASIIRDVPGPIEALPASGESGPGWIRGDLIFRNLPYNEALEETSRRLGFDIRLHAEEVAERKINAAFRAPLEPLTVLEGLCRPFGLKFRASGGGYEIYKPAEDESTRFETVY